MVQPHQQLRQGARRQSRALHKLIRARGNDRRHTDCQGIQENIRMLIPVQQARRSGMARSGGRLYRKDTVPIQNQQGNTQHQGQQARERKPA